MSSSLAFLGQWWEYKEVSLDTKLSFPSNAQETIGLNGINKE